MGHLTPQPQAALGALAPRRRDGGTGGHAYSELPAPYYFSDSTSDGEPGGLIEYWHIVRRNKKKLLLFACLGAMLGVASAIPMTPIYRARISVEVLGVNDDFLNTKQSSPVTTDDSSYETSEVETQAKLLESDSLLRSVFAKLDPSGLLDGRKPLFSNNSKGWRKLLHINDEPHLTERERLILRAADSLKIRTTPRTRVIEATVNSPDAHLASDFANVLAMEYIEQNIKARWNTTEQTSEWLKRELGDARERLQTADNALQEYARNSGLIFTDETTNIATEKLQQLQQQLTAVTADRIARESRYELARNAPPDSLPDVLNDDNLRKAQANIALTKARVAELSAIYTPDYSKVREAEAQLNSLQAGFDHDRAAILERISNDYHEALRKENLLVSAYDTQTREVTDQGEKSIQYNILKREVDSSRQLYDMMLLQLKQSSIALATRASNVRIVDPAEVPDSPFWPNSKILGAAGLLVGLMSGVAFVLIRERTDRSIQQPGEVQLWTNLPELGTIPYSSAGVAKHYGRSLPTSGDAETVNKRRSLVQRTSTQSVELVTWHQKPSLVAEAFRSALTSILFVAENGSRPRVLAFTSSNASDGKTTVVSNLAIATAEIHHRVLVIDADLRRPRMHEIFDVPNDRGLSDLLREELSDQSLRGLIHQTQVPGLHVLTGGGPTHSAANLLYSPNLAALLKKFKDEYDMVLIDTPPMLQMTDARLIGRLADAVVLVARSERTTRDAIVAAAQRLSEDRIRVLGTVLNGWDPHRAVNGHYGYYLRGYDTYKYVAR